MWSSLFPPSNTLQPTAPQETPILAEQFRLQFLNNLPKIKSLPSDNYTSNCNAVLEHARPRGAILSIYYLHKHKLMGKANSQFLFDTVIKSEHPMLTAMQIHGFINLHSLSTNDLEYSIKIQGFMNKLSHAVEAESHAAAEKYVTPEQINKKEPEAEQSDNDEEDAEGFVVVSNCLGSLTP